MTTSRRWLALVVLAVGCSLEPNPSPYPIPGGPDVGTPFQPDTLSGASDVAMASDTSSPEEDAVPVTDVTQDDVSSKDATDGSDDDAIESDVEPSDVLEDSAHAGVSDIEEASMVDAE